MPGKDYIFVNGDNTDYRYQNIKVINRYTGVTLDTSNNGQSVYITKIHINGDYIVGRYKSETDAAIAYNKAVNLLTDKGYKISYQTNYIENMDSSEYTHIYNQIKISKKLTDL